MHGAANELQKSMQKDQLKQGLRSREDIEALHNKNIITPNIAPQIAAQQRELQQARKVDLLQKKLINPERPDNNDLVDAGILYSSTISPAIQSNAKDLEAKIRETQHNTDTELERETSNEDIQRTSKTRKLIAEKGIIHDNNQAAANLTKKEIRLNRKHVSTILDKRFALRKKPEELEEKGVLPKDYFDDPQSAYEMRQIQRKLAKEDLKRNLKGRITADEVVQRGIAYKGFLQKSPNEIRRERRKEIKQHKKQLNEKLHRDRRPNVHDLVAKQIIPEDKDVIQELKNIAQSHKRMESAVYDLSSKLPFEDDINLTVAKTMMRHLIDTCEDVELEDCDSDLYSDEDNDTTNDLDAIQKRNTKRRMSETIINGLNARPTKQESEDRGIAKSLRGNAVALEERINSMPTYSELVKRNIIKRPNISRSLGPNAEALEKALIRTKKGQNPSYYKHDIAPQLQSSAKQLHMRRLSETIKNQLNARPTKQELVDQRILYNESMANLLQGNALRLEEQLRQRVPEKYLKKIGVLIHDQESANQDIVKIIDNKSAFEEIFPHDNDKTNYRLRRTRISNKLEKCMSRRMSEHDLIKANIVPQNYFVDPYKAVEMRQIQRKLAAEDLKSGLKKRSTVDELVLRGLTRYEYFNMDMDQAKKEIAKHSKYIEKIVEDNDDERKEELENDPMDESAKLIEEMKIQIAKYNDYDRVKKELDDMRHLDEERRKLEDNVLNYNYGESEQVIKRQMQLFEEERKLINEEMSKNVENEYMALCKFSCEHVRNKIKWWCYNDVAYRNGLNTMMRVMANRELHGNKVSGLKSEDIKLIIKNEIKVIMTDATMNVMFECFDKWRNETEEEDIMCKAAAEIAYILYHYPLHNLLDKIISDNINGATFVKQFEAKHELIKKETGWKQMEIYQIESVLFQHQSMSKMEFVQNLAFVLRNNPHLSNSVKDDLKECILSFDVVVIHSRIKYGLNNIEFNEKVINLVDELNDKNEEKKTNNNEQAYLEPDFVQKVYEVIAACLLWNKEAFKAVASGASLRKYDWKCFNCGNRSFCSMIDGQRNTDLSTCLLCGASQKYAIILNVLNYDTLLMVNDAVDNIVVDNDDIDTFIQTIIRDHNFNLFCLNDTRNKQCSAMIRLCKCLIKYKRWLYTIKPKTGTKDIDKTIQVDIAQNVDNETFQKVVIEATKTLTRLKEDEREKIYQMIQDLNDMFRVENFLKTKKKTFRAEIKKQLAIKPAISGKLYSNIKKTLNTQAQRKQFGDFLSSLDIQSIQKDYHHILRSHIRTGNQDMIRNTFSFFAKTVHYDDTHSEAENCSSCKRRILRTQRSQTPLTVTPNKEDMKEEEALKDTMNALQDKDIWSMKQYHTQSQLDIIHSYLVHFDWKSFIMNKCNDDNDTRTDSAQNTYISLFQNSDKYVTEYGFGVGHEHAYLSPKFNSIRAEILYNKMQSFPDSCFQNLFTKAIHLYSIAISDEYKDELYCTYFSLEYNIIRNEAISIRHILAIVMYTDLSDFCTAFRSTYRKLENEIDVNQVSQRHRELYFYSRSMFEALEFFGNFMDSKIKVYHGLNCVMHFDQFTAYFNQPISCTTDYSVAQRFSQGSGIILTLKSGSLLQNDPRKIPKYLSVSWMSSFPEEDESLFYGAYVVFKIHNITEADTLKGHRMELKIFNMFQSLLQNGDIEWKENNQKEKKLIQDLVAFIKNERNSKNDDGDIKGHYITSYGTELFHHFCANIDQITIKQFTTLPKDIFVALFHDEIEGKLSLIPIVKLFGSLQEVTLTQLLIGEFAANCKQYTEAAIDCINISCDDHNVKLEKIMFQSVKQNDRKQNTTLQKMVNNYANKVDEIKWKIKYQLHETHNVILTDYHYFHIKDIKECKVKEMIYLVKEICNASNNLKHHQNAFIFWIEENHIDGIQFLKYRKESAFAEAIMNNFNQNEMIKKPSIQLFKGLNEYNFSSLFNEKLEAEKERERIENEKIATELQAMQLANELKIEQQKSAAFREQVAKDKKYEKEEQKIMKQQMDELHKTSNGCIVGMMALQDELKKQKEIIREMKEREKNLQNEMKEISDKNKQYEMENVNQLRSNNVTENETAICNPSPCFVM